MLIGLTYDLRQEYLDAGFGEEETAEFDRPDTIEAIENTLRELGHETDRIGRVTALVERLDRGDRWDLVYNIAEGMYGIGREAQVPALLDAFNIPYTYSDPLICALSLHKGMTKRIVRDLGLPTPNFVELNSLKDIAQVATAGMSYPLFAKPIGEGTSKGVTSASKITSESQLREVSQRLLAQFNQPVLIEEFLPGREFTVGIVGTGEDAQIVAVMEVNLLANAEAEVYTYTNKELCEDRVKYTLASGPIATEASELSLAVWRGLGCRDGGRVDVRADRSGRLSFIEVNPLPGIHPEHSDLPIMATLAGWTYRQLIQRIVASASKRLKASAPNACGSVV
jgi:D-alanine-D-alanine ligase